MRGATATPRGLGWLLLPAVLVLALFLGAVALLFLHAFWTKDGFSLAYFKQILDRADYHEVFLRTVSIAAIVSIASALLAYPIAWLLWRLPKWRNLLLVVVLVPWLVSLVVRTYGWLVILGPKGFLNETLRWAGVIESPLPLIFNDLGVVIGLTHVLMPFSVIATLSVLLQIDNRLEEASESLGAGALETWRRVVLPLSLPGVFTGISITFLTSMGAIVTPILLGGIRQKMAGTQIYQEVVYNFNMSKASAWALCLLILSALGLVLLRTVEAALVPKADK
ncbi:MAG: ABC transporter permease [Alphaproteobacteria bacterium]|jgi:putative spermidine/putrescine transport system permease protein|nr:ABC transporter permease [Alphaproteobacteria bacterium]